MTSAQFIQMGFRKLNYPAAITFKKSQFFSLIIITILFLSACEQTIIISENRTDSITSENTKEEFVWFNLFLPSQTLHKLEPKSLGSNVSHKLEPKSLGSNVSFKNFKMKDINQQHNIDIQFSPNAISFYSPKFDSEKDPLWIIIETEQQQFIELKVKVFPTGPLEIYSGESNPNPELLILKGISANTSTWNNEDIYIGWTHQTNFDPEFSKVTLSYYSERYDPQNIVILSLSNILTYLPEDNIWKIDKTSFSKFIQDIPVENMELSINLISEDSNLTELFEFEFYKTGLQKKVLIPD